MRCKIFEDREGWNGENVFLFHQPHGLFAELVGVIDGSDSGLRSEKCSGLSGGMHGDASAQPRRFFDSGFELRLGVLVRSCEFSIVQRVGSGLINLDEVRAFLELLPHHCYEFVGVVGIICVGQDVLLRVVADAHLHGHRGC